LKPKGLGFMGGTEMDNSAQLIWRQVIWEVG